MRCRLAVLILAAGLFGFSPVQAQSPAAAAPGGSNIYYGVHFAPSLTTLGPGLSGGVTVEANRHVFSLRTTSTAPTPADETWDVGLLYGRAVFIRSFVLSASTGVAVVSGTRYRSLFGSGPGRAMDTMIGFPLEGTAVWSPVSALAVGVRAFANVNTEQPFGGIGLTVHVGRGR